MFEPSKVTGHVDAVFGGARIRFMLSRDRTTLVALEKAIGSLQAAWGRLRSDTWTMNDVRSILVHAFPRSLRSTDDALQSFLPRPAAGRISRRHESVEEHVDAVIGARPLATYVPLVTAIVVAAVYGQIDGALTFDEDVPGGILVPSSTEDGTA